ncbi:zinc finger protein, partial [Theobroma cacao]
MESVESMDRKLCAKACSFNGSAQRNNLCSQCYKDFLVGEFQNHNPIGEPLIPTTDQPLNSCFTFPPYSVSHVNNSNGSVGFTFGWTNNSGGASLASTKNRCNSRNKRVGLTRFTCRCGNLFCGKHRYPEEHECCVDLKAIGREALVKENPDCKGVGPDNLIEVYGALTIAKNQMENSVFSNATFLHDQNLLGDYGFSSGIMF